jgi:hypothetical protein
MTRIVEINCTTGIEIIRDMTVEELAVYEIDKNQVLETEETPSE